MIDNVISTVLETIPFLIWPLFILLATYGLFTILNRIYEFFIKRHSLKKEEKLDIISDYKEMLSLKDQRLKQSEHNISILAAQLTEQQLTSSNNLNLAKDIFNENSLIKNKLTNALMASNWMFEREKFTRRCLFSILSKVQLDNEVTTFLNESSDFWLRMIDSNEEIISNINYQANDLSEEISNQLGGIYFSLDIKHEIQVMEFIIFNMHQLSIFNPDSEVAATNQENRKS